MSFTFNGRSSDYYNVVVEKCPSYPVATRVVEHISIPGRSGDLIRDTGAYSNVDMVYSIYYNGKSTSFQDVTRNVAQWLNGSSGYCRLEDTYDPNVYRMAVMSNYTEYRNFMNDFGRADVTFSCKPQRWLKSGETLQAVPLMAGTLYMENDYMDCYPIYAITENTSITIGGYELTVSNNSGKTIYIDSESEDCWSGSLTRNESAVLPNATVSSGTPTATRRIPFSLTGLTNVYLTYKMVSWASEKSGVLEIPVASNFSQTISNTIPAWSVTVSKTANDPNITFTYVSGTGAIGVSSSVSTAQNRNDDVSGTIVGVPEGGSVVTKSNNSATIQWIPRWWTL